MHRLFTATFIWLSLLCCAAFAQEEISEERKQKALEMLEVSGSKEALAQVREQVKIMMQQQFAQNAKPEADPARMQAIQEEAMAWMDQFLTWESMQEMYVEIYAEVFTVEEMQAVIDFYKSEAGQKMLEKMPELVRKSMEVTQKQIMDKMPEFQKRMEEKLEDAGQEEASDPAATTEQPAE